MSNTTIFRIKHDSNNPYVILSKASLWDKALSLKAVGLWARLMSRPDNWTIRASELAKSCDLNEETINKIINELVLNGYAHRRKIKDPITGLYLGWETVIFEEKQSVEQIQKDFSPTQKPTSAFPTSVSPTSVNTPPTNIDSTDINKKDISYVGSKPPTSELPPLKERIEEKKPLPIEAWDAANALWAQVLKHFPKHLPPKLDQWAKHFDIMNRRDKRDWEDIRRMIDFVFEDAFWVTVIHGPESLRKSFDKILAKMTPVDNSGSRVSKNTETAIKIKNTLSQINEQQKLAIYKNTVVFVETGESISLNLPTETFQNILVNRFQLKVKNA